MSQTAQQLLNASLAEGTFNQNSLNILTNNNLQTTITNALGVDPNIISSSEVVLIAELLDNSGSMSHLVTEAVQGCNLIDQALLDSKQSSGILKHVRLLNGGQVHPFAELEHAPRMTAKEYHITGATPLYREIITILGVVGAKVTSFSQIGVPARCVTVILTDGANYDPGMSASEERRVRDDCKILIDDLLRQENHIIIAVGIDDGSTDFKKVFMDIGVPEKWILTPGNTESEVRKAFQVVSRSTVRASQTAGSFSQTVAAGLGGFGS